MKSGRSQRSLRNMKLTRKHHLQYMGLWILITVCMLVMLNVAIYFYVQERWANSMALGSDLLPGLSDTMHTFLLVAMGVEVVVFSACIVFLAKITAHRVAGPYIRLRAACDDVASGNFDYVLRFRAYDRLEDVEQAFNRMMAAFRHRAGVEPAGKPGQRDSCT